jgi:hypothetical protein
MLPVCIAYTSQKSGSHLHHGGSLKSRTVRSQGRIHVSFCNTSNQRGHDVMRIRRMVNTEVLSILSDWSRSVTDISGVCAYRKQLCTVYKPTNHIFPRCNNSSDLCRRLLIADSAGVCLMFTFHWNWFFFWVTKLLACLCSDSHHKRTYAIGQLAGVFLFTPYTHFSYMRPVLSLVIQQLYVPNSCMFYGTSYTPWMSNWGGGGGGVRLCYAACGRICKL